MFLRISIMKNMEWCWKFSIFGQNSRFLKVLAHEISDEIPKKLKFFILMEWIREVINNVSQDKHHEKFGVVVEVFNFWSKFSMFKGVSPRNKWRIPKKLKFSILVEWQREVINNVSQNKHHENFGVVVEVFNFWLKFSIFKGVSPRNKWRNPKKIKKIRF